jgi:hypothetical protein
MLIGMPTNATRPTTIEALHVRSCGGCWGVGLLWGLLGVCGDAENIPHSTPTPHTPTPPSALCTCRIGRTGRAGRKGTAITFLAGHDSEVCARVLRGGGGRSRQPAFATFLLWGGWSPEALL